MSSRRPSISLIELDVDGEVAAIFVKLSHHSTGFARRPKQPFAKKKPGITLSQPQGRRKDLALWRPRG